MFGDIDWPLAFMWSFILTGLFIFWIALITLVVTFAQWAV